jgi:hypothetical protein
VRLLSQAVEAAIARLSPLNPYGNPKFRLIHGSRVFTMIEGWWEDCSPEGLFIRRVFEKRLCHKYLTKMDCWVLECWEPPEFWGSPEEWARQTRQWEGGRGFNECGPYPSEGDYRYLTCFRHRITGIPTEPTELLIEHIFSRLGVPTQGDLDKQRNAKDEADTKARRDLVDGIFQEMPFTGKDDAINLNPRGLLDKLREQRLKLEKDNDQYGRVAAAAS